MADPTFVQATGLTASAGAGSIAAPAMSTTTGNYLFVLAGKYQSGTTITGVTDTAGNTYTRAGSSQAQDSSHAQDIWYTASPITGNASNVVTVTFSGSSAFRLVSVAEFSPPVGATACAYASESTLALSAVGRAHVSNTLTTTAVDALVLGGFVAWDTNAEHDPGTNGTSMWEDNAQASSTDEVTFAYLLTDAAGSYTIDIASDRDCQRTVNAKSFNFTVGGASTPPSARLSLLGVG